MPNLESLIQFDIGSFLSLSAQSVVWIVFLVILVVYAAYSAVLLYHWLRYAFASLIVWPMIAVYFGVSFVIFSTMFFAAINIA